MDDLYIIVWNRLVHSVQGTWRGFTGAYWPPDLGGQMYRPLPLASFAVDWAIAGGHPACFHAMNLLWHAGMEVLVAAVARRWADWATALGAGLVFAVHPVHVEAVANVIGLGELMAAAGVCLAVYAAVVRPDVLLSGAALLLGLLRQENAVVAPALIACAWVVAPPPPSRNVRFGLDRDRVSARVYPAVLSRRAARRADVLPAVGRLGAPRRCGPGAPAGAAASSRSRTSRPGRRCSLGAANTGMA